MSGKTGINSQVTGRGTLNYLIVMPLFQSHPEDTYYFPLGVPYISSAMKKAGYNVHTLNLNHKKDPYQTLRDRLHRENIDVVLTGALSPQFAQIKTIFDIVKEEIPEILTIAGGGIVSGDPVTTMTALETVDYGIVGEGEETIVELCQTLQEGGSYQGLMVLCLVVMESMSLPINALKLQILIRSLFLIMKALTMTNTSMCVPYTFMVESSKKLQQY